MACPSCGKKFYSDFKIRSSKEKSHQGILTNIFEMPSKVLEQVGKYFKH